MYRAGLPENGFETQNHYCTCSNAHGTRTRDRRGPKTGGESPDAPVSSPRQVKGLMTVGRSTANVRVHTDRDHSDRPWKYRAEARLSLQPRRPVALS